MQKESVDASESALGTGAEENVEMDLHGKQIGEDNDYEDEEEDNDGDEEEDNDEEECTFQFRDGVNPLDFMENDASGIPFYQHLERLEYEVLAEKKRKALADNHGEGSTKKTRLEDLSGVTMEEIMEAMNYGVRRKSRKVSV